MSVASPSPPTSDGAPTAVQSKARLNRLLQIEQSVQNEWEKNHIFEQDAGVAVDRDVNSKYFATFPYPYMNGILHLGHAFTFLKADFQVAYQRLKGKTALFPFGFHCTGMPIQAAADRLKREIQKYGLPPTFPAPVAETKDDDKDDTAATTTDAPSSSASSPAPSAEAAKKKKGGKAKVASKSSTAVYQWNIMKEMGIPEGEIHKFQDGKYWLTYFPPIAIQNLKQFGVCVDFRRSFITTDINPFYDRFIQWQFNTLRARDKIAFGNRPCIFSPIDNQACADHDRAEGEGVGITEYTLIKLELQQPYPDTLIKVLGDKYKDAKVILPAATLRPETMYGQTNAWMLPDGEYGVYVMNDGEIFVCAPRSAYNMSYQHLTSERGKPNELGLVSGSTFMGAAVKAPHASFPVVYVLPLLTIKMDKGTGVVTSVPSDAPDDYAALMDLKNKPSLRTKYNIRDEHVLPFDVIPIIDTPGLGTTPAKDLCESMKVTGQNDREKLAEIKDKVYKEGFAKGVMIVSEYKGQKVSDAKPLIKALMIKNGNAAAYSEPESKVVSRSGNECVVAFTDQWYLKYGENEWKNIVKTHIIDTLDCFSDIAKGKFEFTIEWLHEWACSRSYGLGTFLPWDTQYVIESLSDSTIYMAYYTISHFLQGGVLDGSVKGTSNISPEQLTDDVFNYIFLLSSSPPSSSIPITTLNTLRNEFAYWYPMDLRVSGKDLIPNHLTMSLYNHAAIWDKQPNLWPRGFYSNGHVMVEAEKMSKSKGNFIILPTAVQEWGADATRFALADAGDGMEDSNFEKKTANAAILRLTKEETFVNEMMKEDEDNTLRVDDVYNFWDEVFLNDISIAIIQTDTAYARMRYRDALKYSCYDLHIARDAYRLACSNLNINVHRDVIRRYIYVSTLLLSPICPHYAQEIWSKLKHVTKTHDFIHRATWPSSTAVDSVLTRKAEYIRAVSVNIRTVKLDSIASKQKLLKKQKDVKADDINNVNFNALILVIALEYPDWQQTILKKLSAIYSSSTSSSSSSSSSSSDDVKFAFDKKSVIDVLKSEFPDKKKFQDAMKFTTEILDEFALTNDASVLDISVPFNEYELVKTHASFISRGLDLSSFQIVSQSEVDTINIPGVDLKMATQKALPGKPSAVYFNQ